MPGDYGDLCQELRDTKREDRTKYGVPCPECVRLLPKACPSILLPGQRCKIHGYRDLRKRRDIGQELLEGIQAIKQGQGNVL